MAPPSFAFDPTPYDAFEDIIDGYFPLQTSVAQLMQRLGAQEAVLELAHAPIMQIPGLPPDAPVPLKVQEGRVGLIESMCLFVVMQQGSAVLSGTCQWHWLNGDTDHGPFDAGTRLAEPAFLEGYAQLSGNTRLSVNAIRPSKAQRVTLDPAQPLAQHAALKAAGFESGTFLGPLRTDGIISDRQNPPQSDAPTKHQQFLLKPA